MRATRPAILAVLCLLVLGACGADSGRGASPDEEPEAAPQTVPGLEPAEVPETLQQDSSDVR